MSNDGPMDPGFHDLRRREATLFRGLADETRLALLDALVTGPKSVSELARIVGLAQPTACRHLSRLWRCGFLDRARRGESTCYWIASGVVMGLRGSAGAHLERAEDRSGRRKGHGGRAVVGSRSTSSQPDGEIP